ncbi:CPBP family glutamic-type intramembrane protease [Legionella bononiensis]|uniref:CPBP family intramembrane metalloprotease n=1 Tax=Legionella bononiensis TaxID=2793102 RepID=A0ABS1WA21_9GAMM|nr:CPBP family glutamic-type intramembrane protease [Legionella bononiensis]MBL7480553.1 CPBP family intramembrane metalloprotease [Legionella bononiensis]MBL7526208.1 CPBP family intramembrane metalloprotease [Legionella bononiensis]MBL7563297.1 CPBP family intramembrane metalloprotease [Legionella bononiensis]
MIINWPLIIVLFCLCIPGVSIAMSRLIYFLLPQNSDVLKKRFSRFAVLQTLLMVFVMSFAGSVLSEQTGLNAPLLEAILAGKGGLDSFQSILFPTFLYTLVGTVIFFVFYYGIVGSILDEHSFQIMAKLRAALGIDGCVLYGGVVEEIIVRWGLMNVVAYFGLMFAKQKNNTVIVTSIILSGLLFAVGQVPAYIAAGCIASRRFLYSLVLLSLWQSLLFGFLFWYYGLVSAILGHMLFHLAWGYYDKK